MSEKRTIEIFSAGCPACEDTIQLVNQMACPSCEVSVLDVNDATVAGRAKALGVQSVPAVAINGELADCCASRGPDAGALQAAGLGQAV
ncbi:MAG: thioredoxin family protein [Verrucomicrobia subdivision 3 bacterium]|nr:thioredoxin family protein [Limisphaerales bacterium]